MMTIAEQLNITEFPFIIKDGKGNKIYWENSKKFWYKQEFDPKGNETYHENSDKFWEKTEYDSNDNETYYEDSNKFWYKREFDSNDNEIYFEDSNGTIRDDRPKSIPEYTMEELTQMLGKEFKVKK